MLYSRIVETLRVGVIGLGKLGLPLAATFANSDFPVLGIDQNVDLISQLNLGNFDYGEPGLNTYLHNSRANMKFSNDFSKLNSVDIVYLIVPTPSDESGFFVNDFLISAIKKIGEAWKNCDHYRTLVIVSTVMPGSTRNSLIPVLEDATGESTGTKLNVIYAPEFIAIGSVIRDLEHPDLLLIGASTEDAAKDHSRIMSKIVKSSAIRRLLNLEEAEMVKILINNFITTKITFANQIAELTDFVPGTNQELIAEAIGLDTRIGRKYLKPGLGFGGPCFPRDTRALAAFAKAHGWKSELAVAVEEVNGRQPEVIARRILRNYPDIKKVGVYGLSYKEGSSLLEESQALELSKVLLRMNVGVLVFDPLIRSRPSELPLDLAFTNNISDLENLDLLIYTQKIRNEDTNNLKTIKKFSLC